MTRPGRAGGFTLLELLVTISILAILGLIAMPSYWDRIVRQQVNEALPLGDLPKPMVQAAWAARQPIPPDNVSAGLPVPEKIVNEVVSSVTLDNGAIHIGFGNKAHNALKGKTLTLRPAVVEDAPIVPITWLCGYADPPQNMAVRGANKTDVPAHLLPIRCRQRPTATGT